MEDVWKDITSHSSFLHSPLTQNDPTHHGPILRDFFAAAGEPDTSAPANFLSFNRCGGFPCHGGSSVNEAMDASSTAYLMDSFMKKRCSEQENDCSGDRKYKRMMKNRESAVRSRARRNAYRFELEKEKSQLIEENARLRRVLQGQQLFSAATASSSATTTNEEMGAPKQRNRFRSLSTLF